MPLKNLKNKQAGILVNVRSELHFKIRSGYFGYCQISLNGDEFTTLANMFLQKGSRDCAVI